MTVLIIPLLSWVRFHHMRWLQQRAHRAMLRSVRLDRAAADAWQLQMLHLGLAAPSGTWRAPSVPAATHTGRLMPRRRRATEAFGDGTRPLGTIITNQRGHEVYSIKGDYLATFTTLGAARKHLLKQRPKKDEEPS